MLHVHTSPCHRIAVLRLAWVGLLLTLTLAGGLALAADSPGGRLSSLLLICRLGNHCLRQ